MGPTDDHLDIEQRLDSIEAALPALRRAMAVYRDADQEPLSFAAAALVRIDEDLWDVVDLLVDTRP